MWGPAGVGRAPRFPPPPSVILCPWCLRNVSPHPTVERAPRVAGRGRRLRFAVAAALVLSACGQPPTVLIEAARHAMDRAARSGGVTRAPGVCTGAQAALVLAEAEIRVQMKRSSWSRDYDEAGVLAQKAFDAGRSCAAHAQAALELRRDRADRALADLQSAIAHTTALARHVPDGEGVKAQILRAAISLGEGRSSYGQGQYERSEDAAERGRAQVAEAVHDIDRFFDAYKKDSRNATWRRWVTQALAEAKKGETVLIVDKLRRQLVVVKGDDEIASYAVDLGLGGIDSKTRAGDAFTPEGRYKVTEERNIGQTRYHRALMLDYPNAEDQARFKALQRSGAVAKNVRIGSNIEIHGEGGREQDWTQGCVALRNADMDTLVGLVGVGTKVTIVGTIPDGAYK